MRFLQCLVVLLILLCLPVSGHCTWVCGNNHAHCFDLPLEWNIRTAESAADSLQASRFLDGDRVTLTVLDSSADEWQTYINFAEEGFSKHKNFEKYDRETITAGAYEYLLCSYEVFSRGGVSQRYDYYIYQKEGLVKIITFAAQGRSFFKIGFDIQEILATAFFKPVDDQKKPLVHSEINKVPQSDVWEYHEDDDWGSYAYKPAGTAEKPHKNPEDAHQKRGRSIQHIPYTPRDSSRLGF